MFNPETLTSTLGLTIVAAPLSLLAVFGFCSLVDRHLSERASGRLVFLAVSVSLLAAIAMLLLMVVRGTYHVVVPLGQIVLGTDPHDSYDFKLKLLFDLLSLPFVILSLVLCGTISAFATKYLHREPGYNRFFFLFAVFVAGMVATALAGTIETLFTGWELVGLSSAFLVAYFQDRRMPVRNGLHVWSIYRIADAAFLIAAVVLHHLSSRGDFDSLLGSGPWPAEHASLSPASALIVGLLLLVAVAGKSALVPFSGWLPRAMEGPTPSSAVFYGALSVHLGAYLLLRVSPIIPLSPWLGAAIVLLGLTTAVYASLAGRVQTDIKSALCFASLTQVGIIVAEIGLGLRWLALTHLIGHACLRTLQFLRAPTLLQDYRALENALGGRLPRSAGSWPRRLLPESVRAWWYRFALERGYLDALLLDYVVRPFLRLFQWCDVLERKWTAYLAGNPARRCRERPPWRSDSGASAGPLEEVP